MGTGRIWQLLSPDSVSQQTFSWPTAGACRHCSWPVRSGADFAAGLRDSATLSAVPDAKHFRRTYARRTSHGLRGAGRSMWRVFVSSTVAVLLADHDGRQPLHRRAANQLEARFPELIRGDVPFEAAWYQRWHTVLWWLPLVAWLGWLLWRRRTSRHGPSETT